MPGDPGLPGGGPIPSTLAPTTWRNFAPRLGLAWSPNASGGILGKLLGGPGKTSIRAAAGIYYTAIQDAGLFVEVADAPYGLFWVSQSPVLFDQPFLTRADGTSQTQRFPFVLPVPGSPGIKNLDWSVFLPITSSPGYQPGNKLPYGEHFNFSIQRELSSSTVLTLAYVGTEGHKLFAQYEANPGDASSLPEPARNGRASPERRNADPTRRTPSSPGRTARRSSVPAARWDTTSAAIRTNPPTPTRRTTPCRLPWNGAAGISRSWRPIHSASRWTPPPASAP